MKFSATASGVLRNSIVYFNEGDTGADDDLNTSGFSTGSSSNVAGVLGGNVTGNPRVVNAKVNIGAYEWQLPTGTTLIVW